MVLYKLYYLLFSLVPVVGTGMLAVPRGVDFLFFTVPGTVFAVID